MTLEEIQELDAEIKLNKARGEALGWTYGIPVKDGWYWMMGSEKQVENTVVYIFQGNITIYGNRQKTITHEDLNTMYLPITPPVVAMTQYAKLRMECRNCHYYWYAGDHCIQRITAVQLARENACVCHYHEMKTEVGL